jgi:hypothetical protein
MIYYYSEDTFYYYFEFLVIIIAKCNYPHIISYKKFLKLIKDIIEIRLDKNGTF